MWLESNWVIRHLDEEGEEAKSHLWKEVLVLVQEEMDKDKDKEMHRHLLGNRLMMRGDGMRRMGGGDWRDQREK